MTNKIISIKLDPGKIKARNPVMRGMVENGGRTGSGAHKSKKNIIPRKRKHREAYC